MPQAAKRQRPRLLAPKREKQTPKREPSKQEQLRTAPRSRFGQAVPARLDHDLIEKIVSLLKEGLPLDGVCDYLFITTAQFWEWRRRGDEILNSGGADPGDWQICADFVLAMRHAMAEFRLDMTRRWIKADKEVDDWKKYATMLERRDRRTYARQLPEAGQTEEFDPDETFI